MIIRLEPKWSVTVVVLVAASIFPLFSVADPGIVENAAGQKYDKKSTLAYSQSAIGRIVADYRFVDRGGKTVRLSQYRGKPLLISLIYTSCHHTCPTLTNHLQDVVKVAREALGEESFAVISVGFDTPNDTPQRMGEYASARGINMRGWRFLSSDSETIASLSRDAGFVFFPSSKGFDHLAQTTVLDADGKVYAQIYGEMFDPPQLVEPLKRLVFGTSANPTSFSGWVQGVRLFCTIYDPASGRYRFDYSIFISIITGLVSLGAIAIFIVRAWRQTKPPASSS